MKIRDVRNAFFFCFAFLCLPASAQDFEDDETATEGLHFNVEMQASLTVRGDNEPLWLNANKYGLSSLDKSNGYLRAGLSRPLSNDNGRKFGFGAGIDMAVAYGFTSKVIVQQAYVEGRWLRGVLTVGSKEYPLELKNAELSTGSQTLGINARPVPQVRLALGEYWALPITDGWVSIKGHVAYGKTTDDNWQKRFTDQQTKYSEGTLYHSKAGYIKIGNDYRFLPVSLELGLEMASVFGGKSYKTGIADVIQHEGGLKGMWHAFMPGGSETIEAGTAYENASGNQLGSWLFRLNFDYENWYLGVYGDKYFEDHSGMFQLDYDGYGTGSEWNVKKKSRYLLYDFKDILLGLDFRLKDNTWINNVVLEYMYTKYQSGPIYHDHTKNISDHIGGRDNYYNHHMLTGYQHWGQAMGNPLYTSPLYNTDGNIYFWNNRFMAWHLGISGDPNFNLHYRLLATLQRSYGTYYRPYTDAQNTQHLLAEVLYRFPAYSKMRGWSIKAAAGADFGSVYGNNLGFQLTIAKTGFFRLSKK
ncbi:MAG: hypothetical protein IJ527_06275 [Prevotella sp.]|nr:hypothetical protein [Prevotella sp.]